MTQTDEDRGKSLTAYFRRNRLLAIERYRAANLWVQKHDARMWALHYGRLIRKMGDTK